jgi:ABC-type Fe3+-hydroxamate transport system substrate-binding protein
VGKGGYKALVSFHPTIFNLTHRLELITFYGKLFNEEEKAKTLVDNALSTFKDIAEKTKGLPPVKVGWGIWFNRRVFALQGNYWMSELIEMVGGEYIFDFLNDINMELSLEDFLIRSKEVPIFFVNPHEEAGSATKADFIRLHPEASILRAFGQEGRVYGTLGIAFQDTGKIADLALEIASIIHPELYPDKELKYFYPLR